MRRGTGLKVIHLTAAVWSLATGREEEGEGSGPPENTPQPPPSGSSCSFSLDLKNTLAEDIFNNVFLLKKKNTATCSPSVRLALPSRGRGRKGMCAGQGHGELGAVGLLLLEQRHGQLGAAGQPLQVAEAAAVVELLAQPRAAVPQGEPLHQPWLHGPEEMEP